MQLLARVGRLHAHRRTHLSSERLQREAISPALHAIIASDLPLPPRAIQRAGVRCIRINPGVFARLRSFAFNILKANRRGSLNQDRYRAAIGGLERLINLLRIPQR
jgi:hypothetical protein